MKKTFTKEFLSSNRGCYEREDIKRLYTERIKKGDVTLEEIMSSNIPTEDKYWFLVNNVLDLEERKELFLLVMHAVSEATEYITVKEYIDTIIRYANKEVDYDTLDEAYLKTPQVDWVFSYYDYDFCSFSLYQIYWLLFYLNRDESVREVVWEIVNEYI